jgi:hypothetical protein
VKTIQGPTLTWLFDTGADVTVLAMREFRKIPTKKPPTMKVSSASSHSTQNCWSIQIAIYSDEQNSET